jgi:antitoxin HigA-1
LKSLITIEDGMKERRLNPIHPGQILMEEFVGPSAKPLASLAEALSLSPTELEALLRGDMDVSLPIAQSLAQVWGTTPQFWLNLQRQYEERTGVPSVPAAHR